jgi:two-component system sensor histidine kinase VicK
VTEGSGIGLFVAKNIVEAHHGRIWFDSVENKGTTFYVTIPLMKNNSHQGLESPFGAQ